MYHLLLVCQVLHQSESKVYSIRMFVLSYFFNFPVLKHSECFDITLDRPFVCKQQTLLNTAEKKMTKLVTFSCKTGTVFPVHIKATNYVI